MAKHLFHDDNAFSRVYHEDPVTVVVTFLRPEDGFIVENTVPARPTGAHRHDECDIHKAVWVFAHRYIECPRPNGGYEYIFSPRV